VVARELFRVARPWGRVGMVAWTPDSFAVETFEVVRRRLRPPPDLPRAEEWGDEEVVRERFGRLAASIAFEHRSLPFEAESPGAFVDMSSRTPAWAAAEQELPGAEVAAMRAELLELVRAHGGDGRVRVDADYLVAVARRRG
jgi:hypothetical protein